MRPIHILTAVALMVLSGAGHGYSSPARYFWVVRDGLTSTASIDELIDRAQDAGANGLVVQVVGRGEAYYGSSVIPLAWTEEDFDPLQYLVARAKPRGMEVHAWVNAFLVWSSSDPPGDPAHVYHSHPQWFMTDRYGTSTRDYNRVQCEQSGLVGATLSPAVPQVRQLLADIAVEIATGYDVDGIHLDYIRYPNPSFGFEPFATGAFFFHTGEDPLDMFRSSAGSDQLSLLWSEWRQDQVTATVETVRATLRSAAPTVLLSCAVMADPLEAASHYSCDWRSWLEEGLVDFVCPMAYTTSAERARELAVLGTGVCPEKVVHGIGVYNQPVESALVGAIESLSRGSGGICVFSLNSLSDEDAWMLRDFWSEAISPDHQLDTSVFHRVTGTEDLR